MQTSSSSSAALFERVKITFLLMFTADSLSSPVHWFYGGFPQIEQYFGKNLINKLEAAPQTHPSSIMNLHSTKQGGRTAVQGKGVQKQQDIVGDVILKGKKQFWNRPSTHYHHGMKAGENTLNSYVIRWTLQVLGNSPVNPATQQQQQGAKMIASKIYNQSAWLDKYFNLMQEEGSHPDTYAESYHRGFFSNVLQQQAQKTEDGKLDLTKCGAVTHDTPSVGGLMNVAPVAIVELLADRDVKRVKSVARSHLALTHPSEDLLQVSDEYVELLDALLFRKSDDETPAILKKAASKYFNVEQKGFTQLVNEIGFDPSKGVVPSVLPRSALQADVQVVGGLYSTACYISDSWPNVLYLANKYYKYPTLGLMANTNCGGENCHRGSCLGSVLGLAQPMSSTPSAAIDISAKKAVDGLNQQLLHYKEIEQEIDAVLKVVSEQKK